MRSNSYSEAINHALAYAATHHDGDVRKGTRVPYITHPASVAIILARYGRDDRTIVAAILHDVIEDCDQPGHTVDTHRAQIEEKFGRDVLDDVLAVTKPTYDTGSRALTSAENKVRYIENLAYASERARWVCAADKLHNARSIISDLDRAADPQEVWERFSLAPRETVRYYRNVYERLRALGFAGEIMGELEEAVRALEERTPAG